MPTAVNGLIRDPDGNAIQRRARCGRRNWITWKDRDGVRWAAPWSCAAIKAAMLAAGTQREWF